LHYKSIPYKLVFLRQLVLYNFVVTYLYYIILFVPTAPQTAPENFQLTAASSECVKLTYNNVSYPNGPLDGLIYQVTFIQHLDYVNSCLILAVIPFINYDGVN